MIRSGFWPYTFLHPPASHFSCCTPRADVFQLRCSNMKFTHQLHWIRFCSFIHALMVWSFLPLPGLLRRHYLADWSYCLGHNPEGCPGRGYWSSTKNNLMWMLEYGPSLCFNFTSIHTSKQYYFMTTWIIPGPEMSQQDNNDPHARISELYWYHCSNSVLS